MEDKQWNAASTLWPAILTEIDSLPPSRTTVYARIDLAESLMKLSAIDDAVSGDIARILAKAVQQTKNLKDQRAESYALGTLGQLYEQNQQESDALSLTQQAQSFNNQINLQALPVVHLATHGKFSSNAEQTFILAWDKPIKVNELNSLLPRRDERRPEAIELLVLSACETATGDKRAALRTSWSSAACGRGRAVLSLLCGK